MPDFKVRAGQLAEASIPRICDDGPLFPMAWHARIFALIVALVETEQLQWKDFQSYLLDHRNGHRDKSLRGDDIDDHYFEHWLEAAEDALVQRGFVTHEEIPEQMERIRECAALVRLQQTAS